MDNPHQDVVEFDDDQRKRLFFWSMSLANPIFLVTLVSTAYMGFHWQEINFGYLILIFLVSRGADMLITILGMKKGMIELNPLSEAHDISNLQKIQGPQILSIIVISFFLGLINPWIGNAFVLLPILNNFRAVLCNVVNFPVFAVVQPKSIGAVSFVFYIDTLFCTLAVSITTYFCFSYSLS